MHKRIALAAISALFAGMLSIGVAPVANAAGSLHTGTVGAGATNPVGTDLLLIPTSLFVATITNNTGVAKTGHNVTSTGTVSTEVALGTLDDNAKSLGLLAKDTSTGTAQTATMLTSGALSLYTGIATTVAFTATAGSFGISATSAAVSVGTGVTFADPARTVFMPVGGNANRAAAESTSLIWNAPSSAGTYTISMYYASNQSVPTLVSPSSGTLGAQITVTVVAASAGGSFSSAYSGCVVKDAVTATSQSAYTADSTTTYINGSAVYVGFFLRDSYIAYLADGNLVATVTGDATVALDEDGDGSALSAGTGATTVQYGNANAGLVRIDQATAGKPVTTTLTITYNGTTVCTKTVTIRGAASSIEITDVATVDLGGAGTDSDWLGDNGAGAGGTAPRAGHFYAILKDSAGNRVYPTTGDTFSMDPATTTTTVTQLAVAAGDFATTTSTSTDSSKSVGTFTCGSAAGQSSVKLRHTTAATGATIVSPAFTARCADDPYTYTASWDKASYVQGEVATLTVKFLDSKGNPANSIDHPGPAIMVTPMLTAVTATGIASMLPDNQGVKTYTFTVGTATGMTAGTYTSIIDFTSLTAGAATKQTPTYKLSTGGDTTTNADVLKSIVALIASINKQIQALQKLILKR